MKDRLTASDIKERGYRDRQHGHKLAENPYYGGWQWVAWRNGWKEAEKKSKESPHEM